MSSHLSVCPGTGRGKDTLTGGEEDSSSRRPSLAQCRALSVDWPGPRSPHRLYLTVQVSMGHQMQGQGVASVPGPLSSSSVPGRRTGDLPGTCWLALCSPQLKACVKAASFISAYLRGDFLGGDRNFSVTNWLRWEMRPWLR